MQVVAKIHRCKKENFGITKLLITTKISPVMLIFLL